jgi:hypothetical protein
MDSVPTESTQSWIVLVTVAVSPVILLRLADTIEPVRRNSFRSAQTLSRAALVDKCPTRNNIAPPAAPWDRTVARNNRERQAARH